MLGILQADKLKHQPFLIIMLSDFGCSFKFYENPAKFTLTLTYTDDEFVRWLLSYKIRILAAQFSSN